MIHCSATKVGVSGACGGDFVHAEATVHDSSVISDYMRDRFLVAG